MLGQRRRWWPNIDPTLGQRVLFVGCTLWDASFHIYRKGVNVCYFGLTRSHQMLGLIIFNNIILLYYYLQCKITHVTIYFNVINTMFVSMSYHLKLAIANAISRFK